MATALALGTMLAEQGVDAFTIQKLLGHKTLDTSLLYTHISDARMSEAVNMIPRLDGQDVVDE